VIGAGVGFGFSQQEGEGDAETISFEQHEAGSTAFGLVEQQAGLAGSTGFTQQQRWASRSAGQQPHAESTSLPASEAPQRKIGKPIVPVD